MNLKLQLHIIAIIISIIFRNNAMIINNSNFDSSILEIQISTLEGKIHNLKTKANKLEKSKAITSSDILIGLGVLAATATTAHLVNQKKINATQQNLDLTQELEKLKTENIFNEEEEKSYLLLTNLEEFDSQFKNYLDNKSPNSLLCRLEQAFPVHLNKIYERQHQPPPQKKKKQKWYTSIGNIAIAPTFVFPI